MKRTAALCALALLGAAGFTGTGLAGQGGNPGPPTSPPGQSGGAPGQQKKAESPAPPATPAAKPSKPAKPTERAKPKPKAKASSHAKAGKITICHRTGSEKNPFVQITVSTNAWHAHQRHGDLNPVPAGGCPSGPQPEAGGGGGEHRKITICHRTGSEKNPYVQITISENAWPAHQQHGDLNPVPAAGCPSAAQTTTTAAVAAAPTQSTTPLVTNAPAAPVVALGTVATKKEAESRAASSPRTNEATRAAGDEAESTPAVLAAARTLGATVQRGRLPFTGMPLWIPLLAGVGLAATGLSLRRWRRGAEIA
jgi:hypothetical protein